MKRATKKVLSLLLTAAILCSVLVFPAAAAWDGSTVTAVAENNGVYEVSTGAQLAWVAQQVNSGSNNFEGKTVRLTADIDLGSQMWTPIGQVTVSADGSVSTGYAFAGTLDGNNKTISGLYAYDANGGVALFGYATGAIMNLTVSGYVIGNHYTAGVVAVGQGSYSGITSQVVVTAEGNCVGGILATPPAMLSLTTATIRL